MARTPRQPAPTPVAPPLEETLPMAPPATEPGEARPAGEPSGASRYVVGELLGRGGSGEVHLAYDARLDRDVALKRRTIADAGADARFLREARITAHLEHPHVPPVYDIGQEPGGRPFFAMKRIEGETLSAILKRGEASLQRRLEIFAKVCDAVAFAHARGVVHRDLKPGNVMVGAFGEVMVLDWGIAVRGEPGAPASGPDAGALFGTPAYMAPEQAESDLVVDPRTDVYGLGALLYALLVGRAPHEPGEDILLRVRDGRFPAPRQVRRAVPRELEAVVLKAMARRKDDRYPTAAEMREDVQAWLEGRSLPSLRYRWWQRLAKVVVRNPYTVFGILGTSAVAAGSLLAATGLYAFTLDQARDRAVRAEQDAERNLARAEVALARNHLEDGRIVAARDQLLAAAERFRRAGGDPLPATASLSLVDDRYPPPELVVGLDGDEVPSMSLAPDGSALLVVAGGEARVLGLPLGEPLGRWAATPGAALHALPWTSEGPRLAAWEGEDLAVVDPLLGDTVGTLRAAAWEPGSGVAASSDGAVLAWSTPAAGTRFVSLATGEVAGPELPLDIVALDGTGARAVLRQGRHRGSPSTFHLLVHDVGTGDMTGWFPDAAFGWSSEGALVAQRSAQELWIAPPRMAGKESVVWRVPADAQPVPFVVDDDRTVLTFDRAHRLRTWSAADGSPTGERAVQGGPTASRADVAVSADGRWAAVAGPGRVEVYAVFDRSPLLRAHRGNPVLGLDVTEDGALLVTAGWDGALWLWDRPSRTLLRRWPIYTHGARGVALSSDGTRALVGDRGGGVRWLDLRSGAPLAEMPTQGLGVVREVEVLPGDALGVALYEQGELLIWELATGAEVGRVRVASRTPHSLAVSPAGDVVAITSLADDGPLVELLALPGGSRLAALPPGVGARAAWADDGAVLVGAADGCVHRLRGGVETVLACGDESITAVAVSGEDGAIAVGDAHGQLRVVDATGEVLAEWRPHDLSIQELAFVPGERTLLSAGSDGAVAFTVLGLVDPATFASAASSFEAGAPATHERWLSRVDQAGQRGDAVGALQAIAAAEGTGAGIADLTVARAHLAVGEWREALARLGDGPVEGLSPGSAEVLRAALAAQVAAAPQP